MTSGTCSLTPNPSLVPEYQNAYRETIKRIEASLRRGEVPDFDGEIARMQSTVLTGGPSVSGRMEAFSDYRSILTGQCSAPPGHPIVAFSTAPGAGSTTDITMTLSGSGKPRTHVIRGAIDASRLSEEDRERLEGDPNYTCRRMRVQDETRTLVERTFFIPVERHPAVRARRPLLASTD